MGTRADFYVGRGKDAEWIGSIAFDGYPDGIDDNVKKATTEKAYRKAVSAFFQTRDDHTLPDDGWPWPWNDSRTTDYAYAFDAGCVYAYRECWFKATDEDPENPTNTGKAEFPDMTSKKNVAPGRRSGLMIIGGR